MKKSKILSLVLALAMSLSLVPSVATATDNVIYEENFDGKTTADLKAQGYTINDNDSRIVVENGIGVAKTSEGGSGFVFSNLSAKAEGLVRVKYDVKLFNNAFDVNKSLLITDKGNLPLIFFGAYGAIAQDYSTGSWSATLNPVSGVGYGTHWYNVDLLLDFDNGKITVNLKNLDDGTMTIKNLVWDYDTLKSVSTIKGFDTYGWTHGNVADTGYDNILIEYVERPDPNLVYAETFDGKVLTDIATLDGAGCEITDGAASAPQSGGAGFILKGFSAAVADAPAGKVRVKFDFITPDTQTGATVVNLQKNGTTEELRLISYGVWTCLRVTETGSEFNTGSGDPGVAANVWHTNDIVLDFDNNKMIYTVREKETGKPILKKFERSVDLSGISSITGLKLYGWAGPAKIDNIVIEYVPEEIPEVVDPNVFYKENFDDVTIYELGTLEGAGVDVKNGTVVWKEDKSAGGFWFDSLSAKVADAPAGKISLKFDVKTPDTGAGATKFSVKTNGSNVDLVSYGVWNCLRATQMGEELGSPGFQCDVWHTNDIVLDFVNNKVIYNVYEKESGKFVLENFARDVDLSAVTEIKGLDAFGWAGAAQLDNIVMAYVPAEPKEIEIEAVDMTGYEGGMAWDVVVNNFDAEKAYTANFSDGEEVKSGEIDFSNVEADGGSVAFAIFLHTSRANVALDVVAQ